MMKRLRRILGSIYFKFLGFFFVILILASSVIPLVIFSTQVRPLFDVVEKHLYDNAAMVRQLMVESGVSEHDVNEYIDLLAIDISFSATIPHIPPEDIQRLQAGEIVTDVSRREQSMRAYVQIDGRFCTLSLTGALDIVNTLQYFQRMISFVPLIAGGILMLILIYSVVRPVKRLSNAAKEVAKGDLSVQIKPQGRDEIAELTNNFNMMIRELSKNEYLHKDFVNSVSHEFKTPITSLTGYAKLLRDEDLGAETRREYADIIIEQSNRLSRLSTDLLRLAELDNESIPRKVTAFALSEQIRSIVILFQQEWEQKNLSMNIELEEVTISGERELLYIVWTNLLSNAIRYAPAGSDIDVILTAGTPIRVSIQNEGTISEADRENIWNRFYKSDKSRAGVGTGLGLPIAQRIIEIHHGAIELLCGDGRITFVVSL